MALDRRPIGRRRRRALRAHLKASNGDSLDATFSPCSQAPKTDALRDDKVS
jgi:hypothetical protein